MLTLYLNCILRCNALHSQPDGPARREQGTGPAESRRRERLAARVAPLLAVEKLTPALAGRTSPAPPRTSAGQTPISLIPDALQSL
jgi:hypothetical protein